MAETKFVDLFDVMYNCTNGILERLVDAAKKHETNYTFIKQRDQATCHELILEVVNEVCQAIEPMYVALEQSIASSTAKVSELYVRFCETEDTVVNDSGLGEDIKELLKSMQLISTIKEKYKSRIINDREKLQTLKKTIASITDEFLLSRISKGKTIPSSLKSTVTSSTANIIKSDNSIKQAKDWTAYYNPDVEPAIDLLHHIDCKINTSEFNDIIYSTNGQLMAVATGDVAVVFNAKTGAKECELKDATAGDNVSSVCFGSNGNLIVGQGKSIGVWDISQQKYQYTLNEHKDSVLALTYLSNKNYLFSGSKDKTVKVWNMKQQYCIHTLGDNIIQDWIKSVAVNLNEQLLAVGSDDRSITTWDINTGAFLSKYIGHTSWVNSVAFSNDNKLVASGSSDDKVKLWDISSDKCIHTFTHHKNIVWSVAFTPSNWLASGSIDKRVIFHDLRTLFIPCALLQDSNPVRKLAFSPVGKTFATLSENYIRLWKSW